MGIPCHAEPAEKTITIGLASTLKEKREVYRLRYRVYVEELGMDIGAIDHHNKMLYDDMDKDAFLLYAKAGTELVGTIRVNIGPLAAFPPELARILSMDRFEKFYEGRERRDFSYTSKLMVAAAYRNSAALHLLSAKAYEFYCERGVQFNFGVCNFHLLRLYEQLGLHRYGPSFTAEGYDGVLMPVVLLVDDVAHLRAVRSPLYRVARKRGVADDRAAEWFAGEFPEQAGLVNSQLVSEDGLWDELARRLKRAPSQAMPLLRGLTPAEARQFLHSCGIILSCRPGDFIARRGYMSHTLKVLLRGRLRAVDPAGAGQKTVRPGQCFGTSGLVGQLRYTEDIYAATDAEVLVLSRLGFQRFQHSHPEIADKVVGNMAQTADAGFRAAHGHKQRTAK